MEASLTGEKPIETAEEHAQKVAKEQGRTTHRGVDEIQEILMSCGLQQLGKYAGNDHVEVTNG